jgi:hypothetical protein
MENSQPTDFIDADESSVDESETTDSLEQSDDLIDNDDSPSAPVVSLDSLPVTGEARVDDALGRLADLSGLPVHEHVAVFEDVQRRLHETLADLAGQ